MTWLTEDPAPVYWTCAALAIILLFTVFATRRLKYLAGVVLVLLIAAGAWLTDVMVVTDRETVESKSLEMAAAAERGDVAGLEQVFSPQFRLLDMNRDQVLRLARRYLPPTELRSIKLWVEEIIGKNGDPELVCKCMVRASGSFSDFTVDTFLGRMDLTYAKDADGQWRIRRMTLTTIQGENVGVPR
jgi:hypothetical protein